jgi:hypothetical protein
VLLPGGTCTVNIVIDTAGAAIAGYGFEIAWDGGPAPLLTVANPGLNNEAASHIQECASGVVPCPAPLAFNASVGVDNYTASGAGTAGNINDFESIAFVAVPIVNALAGKITFTALAGPGGSTTVRVVFGTGDSVGGTPAQSNQLTVTVIPEPATASMLALGLAGLFVAGRRRIGA